MAAVILGAVSEGTWAFLGAVVANVAMMAALVYRQRGIRAGVESINRAVNHQRPDEPTLVERVITLEQTSAHNAAHREWEREAFQLLAHQVGAQLPEYPDECSPAD